MSEELQNNEFILKGDLGTVNGREITEKFKDKNGTTTLTITLPKWFHSYPPEWEEIRDAEFEIIEPKQIENKPTRE